MRILHTSDWHLGKLMNGISLLEDQRHFLKQLMEQVSQARNEGMPYSAVIVAGDIYDRAVPPEEATELLSSFLSDFSDRFPETHIFLISGNHDSASRLSFASSFFHKHNIHITTNTTHMTDPVMIGDVAFYQLPYLFPLSVKSRKDPERLLRKQQDLYEEACAQIIEAHEALHAGKPSVLVAHPFALGNLKAGSERGNIGTAEQVDVRVFKGFTYCAFGHIHGFHECDWEKRCFYSGAPLAYHVDDSHETFMLDVQIKETGDGTDVPAVAKIPVKPLHPVALLEDTISNLTDGSEKWKAYKDDYVFVVLTDEVSVPNAHARLRPVFPNLVNVKPKDRTYQGAAVSVQQRKTAIESRQIEKVFAQFILDVEGGEPENKELYDAEVVLLKEIAQETSWKDR